MRPLFRHIMLLFLVEVYSNTVLAQTPQDSVYTVVTRVQSRGVYVENPGVSWIRGDSITVVFSQYGRFLSRVAGKSSSSLLLAWISVPLHEISEANRVLLVGPRSERISPEALEPSDAAPRESILVREGVVQKTATRTGVRVSGYYSASLSASRSVLKGRFTDSRSTTRKYATPASTLRLRLEGLPGRNRLFVNIRGSRRFSSQDISGQVGNLRLYELKLSHSARSSRFLFESGRFRNSYTPTGGYWDGINTSFDLKRVKLGASAGFEPDRYTESFQTGINKFSAFADVRKRHESGSTTLRSSLTHIRGSNVDDSFSLFSLEQKTRVGGVSLSSSLHLDQTAIKKGWQISRLYVRARTSLAQNVSLNARYGSRKYYSYWLPDARYSSKKEQLSLGASLNKSNHRLGLTYTSNSFSGNESSQSINTSIRTHPSWLPFTISNNSNYWSRNQGRTLFSSTSLMKERGRTSFSLEYSILSVDILGPTALSHIGGFSIRTTTTKWGYFSLRERLHFGSGITSSTLYLNYGISF